MKPAICDKIMIGRGRMKNLPAIKRGKHTYDTSIRKSRKKHKREN